MTLIKYREERYILAMTIALYKKANIVVHPKKWNQMLKKLEKLNKIVTELEAIVL